MKQNFRTSKRLKFFLFDQILHNFRFWIKKFLGKKNFRFWKKQKTRKNFLKFFRNFQNFQSFLSVLMTSLIFEFLMTSLISSYDGGSANSVVSSFNSVAGNFGTENKRNFLEKIITLTEILKSVESSYQDLIDY